MNGVVHAIVRQPDGGVVFGGEFTHVNGLLRANIARLKPDGSLDMAWNPGTDGPVTALATGPDGDVYAGGTFTMAGGLPRMRLAKFAGSGTGEADPAWNPNPMGTVHALEMDVDGFVFVAGSFVSVGGLNRNGIAKLSADGSGDADPEWNPGADSPSAIRVTDMVRVEDVVFVAGSFVSIGGQDLAGLAKLSTSGSGAADPSWNPGSALGSVVALAADDQGWVYVGGSFTWIGGHERNFLARVSGVGKGLVDLDWDPSPNGHVRAMSVDTVGSIYVGGEFTHVGNADRAYLARLSMAGTGTADDDWNVEADEVVLALAAMPGGGVHAGGYFTSLDQQTRLGFAAIDGTGSAARVDAEKSGGAVQRMLRQPNGGLIIAGYFFKVDGLDRRGILRLLPDGRLDEEWDASITNGGVFALATDSESNVYVGGVFDRVDGVVRGNLAKITGSGSGEVDSDWNPSSDGNVLALAIGADGSIYAGGEFTWIGGTARSYLAKLDGQGVGAADVAWNPSAEWPVETIAVGPESQLYVGGWFHHIGGQWRFHLAKLSGSGIGAPDPDWQASPSNYVREIKLAKDGSLYVHGVFNEIDGVPRRFLAKLSPAGVVDPYWDPSPDMWLESMVLGDDGSVYIGGWFTEVGGQQRNRLAKLASDGTGSADPMWNPDPDYTPHALALGLNGSINLGGTFTRLGNQPRQALAALPENPDWIYISGNFELIR